jgi:hypothetical protein
LKNAVDSFNAVGFAKLKRLSSHISRLLKLNYSPPASINISLKKHFPEI